MRIDYITPATDDRYAEAEVVRLGGSVGVADADVTDAEGHHVAVARGGYKTSGDGAEPWEGGEFTRDEGRDRPD